MITRYWRGQARWPPIKGGQDWPWPFNLLQWWFDQIWAWVVDVWNRVTRDIPAAFSSVFAYVTAWGASVRQWVQDRVGDVYGWLQYWIGWLRDQVRARVGDVWDWIQYWTGWLRDRVGETVNAVWGWLAYWVGWLRDQLTALVDPVWNWIQFWAEWLSGQVGAIVAPVWGWIETWTGWLRDRVGEYAEQLRQRLQEARDWFGSQIVDPWTDWLRSTATQFIGGVRDLWQKLADYLRDHWLEVLRAFGGPPFWAAEASLRFLGDRFADFGEQAFRLVSSHLHSFSPVRISDVPNKTLGLLRTMTISIGGLIAMSLGGEILHPLKQMGLGRVAAMVYDFTRFDTIVDAYIRPIAQASIGIPLRYYANDLLRPWRPTAGDLQSLYGRGFIDEATFRQGMAYQGYPDDWTTAFKELATTLPSEGTLGVMYAKKEISAAKLRESLTRWGYSEEWQDVYTRHLWMDPRLGEIIRISQISPPVAEPDAEASRWLAERGIAPAEAADWWYWYKLSKAGYEPIDIQVLVGVAKMGVVRREQTMFFEAARRLRRDGFIGDERYETLIAEAWKAKNPVAFRAAATALDVEYDRKESLAMITRRAYSRGVFSFSEALNTLAGLGMEAIAARIALLEEKVGLLPRTRLSLATVATGGDFDDG